MVAFILRFIFYIVIVLAISEISNFLLIHKKYTILFAFCVFTILFYISLRYDKLNLFFNFIQFVVYLSVILKLSYMITIERDDSFIVYIFAMLLYYFCLSLCFYCFNYISTLNWKYIEKNVKSIF
jgi:uncharacterized membrane protein YjjP (DUF1212 family)